MALKICEYVILPVSEHSPCFLIQIFSKPKLALNGVGGKSATELLRQLQ